jgi:hypothetical protein
LLAELEGRSDNFNRLILHPKFNDTINAINKLNIQIPPFPVAAEMNFENYTYPPIDAKLVSNIDKKFKLDPKKGEQLVNSKIPIFAYDESINKFSGLQGTAFLVSHSLVMHGKDDYLSSNLLTFNFYTRSEEYTKKSSFIRHSENPEIDSKEDYVKDRTDFIINSLPSNPSINSVVFIDGPLIGGNVSSYTTRLNKELLKKECIPIFFVKNSASNLLTDKTERLKGKYNSDMHWAYMTLKSGERTDFHEYRDKKNPNNAKLFCYLKAYATSPQRIEFHVETFKKYINKVPDLMDLVYYLILVQGDQKNPQIRPIAIAEKYARATLKLINLDRLMKQLGIASTMNQERFGW